MTEPSHRDVRMYAEMMKPSEPDKIPEELREMAREITLHALFEVGVDIELATVPRAAAIIASALMKAKEAGERERMLDFAAWCEQQRYLLGAVDGYDYRSGEEHGLCRAQIEAANRAGAIRQGTGRG